MKRILPLALSLLIGVFGYILPEPVSEQAQVTVLSKQAAVSKILINSTLLSFQTAKKAELPIEETAEPEETVYEESVKTEETEDSSSQNTEKDDGMMWPAISGTIVAAGYPYYDSGAAHSGVDIALYDEMGCNISRNTHIFAAKEGVVVAAYNNSEWNDGFGNHCIIDHGDGTQTLYAHASEIRLVEGDTVNKGQIVGLIGDTGNTTAPHLHFEVRVDCGGYYQRVNPLNYISEP